MYSMSKKFQKTSDTGKVTGTEKNVTHRKSGAYNPFYYAYNYYFRYFIKENNSPFCICVYDGSVNKKMSPSGSKRVTQRVFCERNTRSNILESFIR